jgi:hypothetical protein
MRSAKLKARKAHRCGECRREIAPGEIYERTVSIYDGTASTYKTCAHCLVLGDWLSENCDGYIYTEVVEDFQEHASEYSREDIGALAAMAGRHWRTTDGALLPIPLKPAPIKLGETRA